MIKYLLEIKNRSLLLFIMWLFTLLISYFYKETLLFIIVQPNRTIDTNSLVSYFIFTNITEILSIYIKLITFLSFQVFMLGFAYHFFTFFSPALFKTEYNSIYFFCKMGLIVWFSSVIIANYILLPLTWNFFLSFHDLVNNKFINLHFEAKLSEYLNFFIMIYYLCIFYSQIFTILFYFLGSTPSTEIRIKKFRKMYYYFFIIFSTLISPPDVLSQIFISLLIICLYECLALIFILNTHLTSQAKN